MINLEKDCSLSSAVEVLLKQHNSSRIEKKPPNKSINQIATKKTTKIERPKTISYSVITLTNQVTKTMKKDQMVVLSVSTEWILSN
jgi:hypothetical protein